MNLNLNRSELLVTLIGLGATMAFTSLLITSQFLRPQNMPQRALLADYNCVWQCAPHSQSWSLMVPT